MFNRAPLPLTLICTVLLAACAGTPDNHVGTLPSQKYDDVDKTLMLAEKKKGSEAINLYLSAVDLAWQQGDTLKARTLLEAINLSEASPAQLIFAYTLTAELAIARKQPELALQILNKPEFQRLTELPLKQQARSQLARAQALEDTGRPLAAARERIFTAPYLTGEQANTNHEHIWQLISQLPSTHYQIQNEPDLDGWIELAKVTKSTGSLEQKQQEIQHWVETHAKHPAAIQLPHALQALQQLTVQPIKRIAVLLPTADANQNVVNAIRNGLLSAYYHAQETGKTVPELFFYNSSEQTSLGQLYGDLQSKNIDLLIGPWEKDTVKRLAAQKRLPVTTLALNYAETSEQSPPNELFQFGLAAEDEARMAADRAWADGRRNVIILVQSGEWGRRVQNAFNQRWLSLGGQVAGSQAIGQPIELAQQIGTLLQLRDSEARSKRLQNLLGTKLFSNPSRRRDVDFIFLAASPLQARQIQPTLRFQYAGDLPIYATSSLNPSSQDSGIQQDLEGIFLTEIPWLFNTDDPLRQQIITRWPEADAFMGRFYAMGADAYQLALQLQQLKALPNSKTEGYTGSLQLNQQQQIERTLYWAKIKQGKAVPVLEDE